MRNVYREDHEQFRTQVRRFVEKEITPFYAQWEEQGLVPKSVWRKAGAEGLLNPMLPEPFGGGGDFGHSAVLMEEFGRANCLSVAFPLHSDIVAPYIFTYGSQAQKERWLPGMVSGELIGAIAMTEPGTGSDLKAVRTSAVLEGEHYVLNGQKTFISNGQNAGVVIVIAKTDPAAGAKGISLLVVEEGMPGFKRGRNLKKIGLHAQDTSELFFEDVRVPRANLLGQENLGFKYLMQELAQERLVIAVRAAASIEAFLARTIMYTRDRKIFGNSVLSYQNTRFKLAEAKAQCAMLRSFVDDCLASHFKRELTPERAAMAKLNATEMQGRLLDEFLQLHGGYGYMSEYQIGGAWVDARVSRIYGGSSEVMKEIIARTLERDLDLPG